MNSRWNVLPNSYWLQEVSLAGQFAHGGEAVIRKGTHNGKVVAIRQFPTTDHVEWGSVDGRAILKVRRWPKNAQSAHLTRNA